MPKTNIKGLSEEVVKALAEYKDEIVKGIEKEKEIVSKKSS